MAYNEDKVDEMTLALLYLVMTQDREGTRAWKGFDWETMDRLNEKGYISNPKGKAKSVTLSDEGRGWLRSCSKSIFRQRDKGCQACKMARTRSCGSYALARSKGLAWKSI